MSGYFIAGTDTGVGKTRVMKGLLLGLVALGHRPLGMKPVAAGLIATDQGHFNEDVLEICSVTGQDPVDRRINPYALKEPLSPHISAEREGICIDIESIHTAFEALSAEQRPLLIEGAGGWLSPISGQQTMADIAVALRLPVLLVVGLRLGCLNHAQLTAQAIRNSGLPLAGWLGTQPQREFAAVDDNVRTLSRLLGAAPLAVLPWQPDPHSGSEAALLRAAAAQLFA